MGGILKVKIYRNTKQLSVLHKPIYLTIGTFDGVHKGHLKVLKSLKAVAAKNNGVSCVLTFKQHPASQLHPFKIPKFLTSTYHRLALMEQAGIDTCLLLDFSNNFLKQTPEAFVKDFLVNKLKVKEVHLGYRSKFGFHRSGSTKTMARLAKKYNFKFKEIKPCLSKTKPISSTLVRGCIQVGNFKEASRYLGRPYSIYGLTVKGRMLGRKIGYPTANLDIQPEIVPPLGVYAVSVNILKMKNWVIQHGSTVNSEAEKKGVKGILNFGVRPTVSRRKKKVIPEVHLLNFKGQLYGRILEVIFCEKIREERAFASIKELKVQIALDERKAIKSLR